MKPDLKAIRERDEKALAHKISMFPNEVVLIEQDIPALLAYIDQLEASRQWVSVAERLPGIDYTQPEYGRFVKTIAAGKYGFVGELHYRSKGCAKTESGRKPRWEYPNGRIFAGEITLWMLLPPLPGTEGE
jgi:SLT domain-containing protein